VTIKDRLASCNLFLWQKLVCADLLNFYITLDRDNNDGSFAIGSLILSKHWQDGPDKHDQGEK
tara:strand:- start:66 stop:254 length:189 start_codon:yes stop_codon:yes gene_type:complete